MKLYATVQSERGKPATKGGQEFLLIEIEHERKLLARLCVDPGSEQGVALYPVERKRGKHGRARMDMGTGELFLE